MRVVIAEDTVLLCEGLAGLLEDAGHEVVGLAATRRCCCASSRASGRRDPPRPPRNRGPRPLPAHEMRAVLEEFSEEIVRQPQGCLRRTT